MKIPLIFCFLLAVIIFVGGVVTYRYFFIASEDKVLVLTLTNVSPDPNVTINTPKPKSEEAFLFLFDETGTKASDVEFFIKT